MASGTRNDARAVEDLSDRELRDRVTRAERTIAEIDRIDPAEAVRSGKADQTLARYETAIETVVEAEAMLAERRAEHEHRSLPERLRLRRALERGARQEHPAMRWLDSARRFAPAELRGETLVADRLSADDAKALETRQAQARDPGRACD